MSNKPPSSLCGGVTPFTTSFNQLGDMWGRGMLQCQQMISIQINPWVDRRAESVCVWGGVQLELYLKHRQSSAHSEISTKQFHLVKPNSLSFF